MRTTLLALSLAAVAFSADSRPKVRAITAFIHIDAEEAYTAQVEDAMKFLNAAREAYHRAGFEVQGVRIVTQPSPQYIQGMSRDEALTFFHHLNDLAGKLQYAPNIGLLDASNLDLMAAVLAETRLNASMIIAGDDGIRWNAIRDAARLIKTVAARSPHGRGNFNFAATAMVKPYGPFYPGAYHSGSGRALAVGLEGANVVADIFAHVPGNIDAGSRVQRPCKHARLLHTASDTPYCPEVQPVRGTSATCDVDR